MAEIVQLRKDATWFDDLMEYEAEIAQLPAYDEQKMHLMWLVAKIASNKSLPWEVRKRACAITYKHSSTRQTVFNAFGDTSYYSKHVHAVASHVLGLIK